MFNVEYNSEFNINYDKSVFIIIDMLKGFTDVGDLSDKNIKNIVSKIREYSINFKHIIGINDSHKKDDCEFNYYPNHCIEGTLESELCDELLDVNFEKIFYKNSTNGFFSEGFLQGISSYIEDGFDFVISGCCVDICVLQFCLTLRAYFNSIGKKINIIVVRDLVDTYDSFDHPREELINASFYLMERMGIILK